MTVREIDAGPDELVLEMELVGLEPPAVFDYFVQPSLLTLWWPPEADVDARPGGDYVMSWPAQGWHLRGEYTDLQRGHRLAFSWRWDHEPDLPTRHVTIHLEASDGGTRLRLIHGPYGAGHAERADRDSHRDGWQHFLARLAEAVAPAS